IPFLDMGTSGGVSGARHGACFMAGGDEHAYRVVEPLLKDLAFDERGTLFVGAPGSGHFVKLIHNAIEFGMVQAIAEGAEMLTRAEYSLDLPALFENWNHGSVIRSWLVELMRDGLRDNHDLTELSTYVEDTAEVKWVLSWALDRDIPSPVISDSQQALMGYRDLDSPSAKAVALLRHGFGGHPVASSVGQSPRLTPVRGRWQASQPESRGPRSKRPERSAHPRAGRRLAALGDHAAQAVAAQGAPGLRVVAGADGGLSISAPARAHGRAIRRPDLDRYRAHPDGRSARACGVRFSPLSAPDRGSARAV